MLFPNWEFILKCKKFVCGGENVFICTLHTGVPSYLNADKYLQRYTFQTPTNVWSMMKTYMPLTPDGRVGGENGQNFPQVSTNLIPAQKCDM